MSGSLNCVVTSFGHLARFLLRKASVPLTWAFLDRLLEMVILRYFPGLATVGSWSMMMHKLSFGMLTLMWIQSESFSFYTEFCTLRINEVNWWGILIVHGLIQRGDRGPGPPLENTNAIGFHIYKE